MNDSISLHSDDLTDYRVMLDLFPGASACIDLQGNILCANMAAARLLGYSSPEELIGRKPVALMDERDNMLIEEAV